MIIDGHQNHHRAERAYRAVLVYQEDGTNIEESITDFLADLRHLCEESGYDFAERDRAAREHYLAEQEKEDTARCDNCRTPFPVSELAEPENLHERLDPGGVVPAGECPLCGALAYPIDKKEGHQR